MFAHSFFPSSYFAPRYFPPAAQVIAGPAVIPHDDYWDEDGPWWLKRRPNRDREALLARARQEIGLIPAIAETAVERAAETIRRVPEIARSEAQSFDYVRGYEQAYTTALGRVLSAARVVDARALFAEEVRQKLLAQDDEEMILLVAAWL